MGPLVALSWRHRFQMGVQHMDYEALLDRAHAAATAAFAEELRSAGLEARHDWRLD